MENEKRFRVVASCDPYHARMHYRGQEVLKWDGATPIKWIMEDNLTERQAHALLDDYAYDLRDCWLYDEEFMRKFRRELIEDGMSAEDVERKLSWYVGEGFYNDGVLVYRFGDISLRDDVMSYYIEEYN